MENTEDTLPPWANAFSFGLSIVAATGIFALTVLVFVSVFFRYILGSPIFFAEDTMAILLGVTIFTALPFVTSTRKHVKIGLFDAAFAKAPKFNRVRLIFIDIVAIAVSGFMSWQLYRQAVIYAKRDVTTMLTKWPLAPLVYGLAILVVVAVFLLVGRMFTEKAHKTDDEGSSI